jgi:hypothetical protein
VPDFESDRNTFVNEMSEVFMIVQDRGWTVGGSTKVGGDGEALAHVVGDILHPRGVDEGIASWLFVPDDQFGDLRHDYVTTADPSDVRRPSWGCGMLFIYYLLSQLGFSMRGVVSRAADTLEVVYRNLTRDSGAFSNFISLIDRKFPRDGPTFVTTNNPFPLPTAARLSALQYLRQDAPGTQGLRQLIADKNIGNLRALLNSDRPASLIR